VLAVIDAAAFTAAVFIAAPSPANVDQGIYGGGSEPARLLALIL
jgi:hypothetical protein